MSPGSPRTLTTSPQMALFHRFLARWSAFWVPRPSGRPLDGGNCTTRGCDTPATHRLRASCSAKPPPLPVSSALQGPRARMGHRWVAETRQLHTRKVPRRNKTLPARAARPHFRYKTLPARAARPHFRYKTLPVHPKWLDLALFLHAGRVLYRSHRQEAEQGEFCTERQSWGSPTGHQAPPVWRVPEGPVWRARAGFEAQSLAAVPVGGGGARPQYPQTTGVPIPSKFRMQFPHDTDPCTLKNRRISTIRLQHLKYTQGNCMRNWWESGPWGNKQHHADGLARSAAGQRPVSARSALGQRPVSGSRVARPCHGLGYSPGAPRRPNRTRRGWTRGPSTGRRAPWPRSCREP